MVSCERDNEPKLQNTNHKLKTDYVQKLSQNRRPQFPEK